MRFLMQAASPVTRSEEEEVLGVAGVAGNGQRELMDALSGEVLVGAADRVIIGDKQVGRSGRRHLLAAPVLGLEQGLAPRRLVAAPQTVARRIGCTAYRRSILACTSA